MVVDATARLYDVDEDRVVFKKLDQTRKYDQGTITLVARKGKLIDLQKLHESIWATRLSGGTRSGLVSLDVTAIGGVVERDGTVLLNVADSDAEFVLLPSESDELAKAFGTLQAAAGSQTKFRVTGRIDNYQGRWPTVLNKRPAKTRQIIVTGIENVE